MKVQNDVIYQMFQILRLEVEKHRSHRHKNKRSNVRIVKYHVDPLSKTKQKCSSVLFIVEEV